MAQKYIVQLFRVMGDESVQDVVKSVTQEELTHLVGILNDPELSQWWATAVDGMTEVYNLTKYHNVTVTKEDNRE
jgi:hypothetical protein